jgi:hypothetical protein
MRGVNSARKVPGPEAGNADTWLAGGDYGRCGHDLPAAVFHRKLAL